MRDCVVLASQEDAWSERGRGFGGMAIWMLVYNSGIMLRLLRTGRGLGWRWWAGWGRSDRKHAGGRGRGLFSVRAEIATPAAGASPRSFAARYRQFVTCVIAMYAAGI